jgi:hypothetical protein
MVKQKRLVIHIDHPWARCVREDGAPRRAYITTPWGVWLIGEKSQVYDRRTKKFTDRWSYISYRP